VTTLFQKNNFDSQKNDILIQTLNKTCHQISKVYDNVKVLHAL